MSGHEVLHQGCEATDRGDSRFLDGGIIVMAGASKERPDARGVELHVVIDPLVKAGTDETETATGFTVIERGVVRYRIVIRPKRQADRRPANGKES